MSHYRAPASVSRLSSSHSGFTYRPEPSQRNFWEDEAGEMRPPPPSTPVRRRSDQMDRRPGPASVTNSATRAGFPSGSHPMVSSTPSNSGVHPRRYGQARGIAWGSSGRNLHHSRFLFLTSFLSFSIQRFMILPGELFIIQCMISAFSFIVNTKSESRLNKNIPIPLSKRLKTVSIYVQYRRPWDWNDEPFSQHINVVHITTKTNCWRRWAKKRTSWQKWWSL